ncbi:type 2 lanthipeptide synthetase LanM family protein [Allokutzneria sp. A3M-2-11 16]|uniref:type 2 lanthipeptide synthetase LanM family protein n=1 Tax=Allokutzneria sp. A3M-2-11 16 TaxID=2962043 RepID=UPI0020B89CC5|nr:type 2 lanthipeptide synthetase LanM family protein [Allokutzneria sp. A3M-2-11 16]MCP3802646.1 type 2 lanthipeptide synthetase LanM family protein [Allokutzneria sp. A3M-2-11 16]
MFDVRERGGAPSWDEPSVIDSEDRYRALGQRLTDRRATPFATLAEPLVAWAHERLAVPWRTAGPHAHRLPAPRQWARLLLPDLARRLNGMAQRTCLVELAHARDHDLLAGDSGEVRFESFLDWLSEPDNRRAVLARHPVLAKQFAVVARLWLDQAAEFSERLADDLPALVEHFAGGTDPGAVSTVHMGLGDPHGGGRTVCSVRFESGLGCVYKPRSLATDVHFRALVDWLDERLDGPALPTIRCLDRGSHGWAEFVEAADCAPGEPAKRLFRRYGGLMAVLHLVHAGDCHVENMIVAGEHPYLIDLETVFQPHITSLRSGSSSAAEMAAAAMCEGSVLFSGLLPTGARPADAMDPAGLGSSAVAPKPGSGLPQAAIVDAGTDRMRIEISTRNKKIVQRPEARWRPIDHLHDIEAGFTDAYRVFVDHRAELAAADGPLAAFSADRVRCIVRDTTVYGLLLSTSFHPGLLCGTEDRERHFDRLHRDIARRPGLAAFVEAERKDLWRNDIPLFTVGVSGGPVRAADGDPLRGVTVRPGMDIAHEVLDRLGPDDLELQTWLIRTAVTSETIRSELTVAHQRHESAPAAHPVDRTRLADAADAIAERVAALAISADDEAVWLGCSTGRSGNYSVGLLGNGFYDGLTGIATFLAQHGTVRGSAESLRLAAAAARAAVRQVSRSANSTGVGLQGAGGIVYGLAQLHSLLPSQDLLDHAVELTEWLRTNVASDEQFDVLSGAAGAIFGLAALHRVRPEGVVRDAIAAAADRLVSAQRPSAVGAAWTSALIGELGVATQPLGGFAHGTSGIAAALAVAADVLGDARYEAAMRAGLAYEAHLFDAEAGDWRDVRRDVGTDLVVTLESGRSVTWCHGAPGIGIARHIVLDVVDEPAWRDDLNTATAVTLRSGFGSDHSLCHGDLGNLDFLLLSARGDTEVIHRHAAGVLDGVDEHGWRCGLHPNLVGTGLFTGLAGIGYGLLRLLEPETVPSVLALEPPNLSTKCSRPAGGS